MLEEFPILKEIYQLTLKKKELDADSQEEQKRLAFLEKQVLKRQKELDQAQEKLTSVKTTIFNNEKQLENNLFENVKEKLEEETFNLLVEQDELSQEIRHHREFLKGVQETIRQITQEVASEVEKISHNNLVLDERIELLLAEISAKSKSCLTKALEKTPPFSQIQNKHCGVCRAMLRDSLIKQVEELKQVQNCPQCSRLFLPF